LFSLAGCLKVSLEELLLAFGIDIDELRQHARQSESSLASGSQLEVREPGFRFQLNFNTGFESEETCLLRLDPKDLLGLFPPPLHKYLDPKRYRYAVIGTRDDTMGDLIPPRSLVEIDVSAKCRADVWLDLCAWASDLLSLAQQWTYLLLVSGSRQ
jgi:hypothetical protein